MYKFAALAMVALCGAQDVKLDGASLLPKYAASEALGKRFGEDGTLVNVPEWLGQSFADYFVTPTFTSNTLELEAEYATTTKRGASTLGKANVAPENACGMGWAKNEASNNTCFEDMADLKAANWGWTNKISEGESFGAIPVYIGASHCVGGHHRFDIAVKYEGEKITIDLTPQNGDELRAAHIWVGKGMLPEKKSGGLTDSPGSFPIFVNVNDDNVVVVDDGIDGVSDYYFAVHVNVCPGKEPEPVEECPSTFYIAQYHCNWGPCTETVNGGLPALLMADNWSMVSAQTPRFTIPATGTYVQATKMFSRAVTRAESPYSTPQTDGLTAYMGVFATGCDESLTPVSNPGNPGPSRPSECQDHCPPVGGFGAGEAQ